MHAQGSGSSDRYLAKSVSYLILYQGIYKYNIAFVHVLGTFGTPPSFFIILYP